MLSGQMSIVAPVQSTPQCNVPHRKCQKSGMAVPHIMIS